MISKHQHFIWDSIIIRGGLPRYTWPRGGGALRGYAKVQYNTICMISKHQHFIWDSIIIRGGLPRYTWPRGGGALRGYSKVQYNTICMISKHQHFIWDSIILANVILILYLYVDLEPTFFKYDVS